MSVYSTAPASWANKILKDIDANRKDIEETGN